MNGYITRDGYTKEPRALARCLDAGMAFKGPLMDMLRSVNRAGLQGKVLKCVTWVQEPGAQTIDYRLDFEGEGDGE